MVVAAAAIFLAPLRRTFRITRTNCWRGAIRLAAIVGHGRENIRLVVDLPITCFFLRLRRRLCVVVLAVVVMMVVTVVVVLAVVAVVVVGGAVLARCSVAVVVAVVVGVAAGAVVVVVIVVVIVVAVVSVVFVTVVVVVAMAVVVVVVVGVIAAVVVVVVVGVAAGVVVVVVVVAVAMVSVEVVVEVGGAGVAVMVIVMAVVVVVRVAIAVVVVVVVALSVFGLVGRSQPTPSPRRVARVMRSAIPLMERHPASAVFAGKCLHLHSGCLLCVGSLVVYLYHRVIVVESLPVEPARRLIDCKLASPGTLLLWRPFAVAPLSSLTCQGSVDACGF